MVYLVTYSQADKEKVASREAFAQLVVDAFSSQTTANALQWVCSEEEHQNGGTHYHLAVKLDKVQRWVKVRNYIDTAHGLKLHFSDAHHDYFSAWCYVTKEDECAVQSTGHPDLGPGCAPKTSRASERHRALAAKTPSKSKRKARLSSYEVSQIAVTRGIRTRLGLLALANAQKAEGKTDLAEFIVNRGKRVVNDAIEVSRANVHYPYSAMSVPASEVLLVRQRCVKQCIVCRSHC